MNNNAKLVLEYVLFFTALIGLPTALIVFVGRVSKPWDDLKKFCKSSSIKTDALELRMNNYETVQADAIKMREQILFEMGKFQKEISEIREWKSGIETARIYAQKERDDMSEDIDNLEGRFERFRDRIDNKLSL